MLSEEMAKQFFDFICEVGVFDECEGVIRPDPKKVAEYKAERVVEFSETKETE